MRGKRLTKLQQEFIDEGLPEGSYIAFNFDVFDSDNYRDWKRERRANLRKKNLQHTTGKGMPCLHQHQELSDGPYHVCKDCGVELPHTTYNSASAEICPLCEGAGTVMVIGVGSQTCKECDGLGKLHET